MRISYDMLYSVDKSIIAIVTIRRDIFKLVHSSIIIQYSPILEMHEQLNTWWLAMVFYGPNRSAYLSHEIHCIPVNLLFHSYLSFPICQGLQSFHEGICTFTKLWKYALQKTGMALKVHVCPELKSTAH